MKKHTYISIALAALLTACGGGAPSQPAANAVEQSGSPVIAVGETGKAEGIDLTVTDVAQKSQLGPAGVGPKAEKGETFVVVSYTLKNTADKSLPLMERPMLTLIDATGRTYAADDASSLMAAGMMDDPSGMAADLNPNVSAKTKAAWKVDKAAFKTADWKLVVATDPALTFALK